jgi:hypothetical protein
MNKKKLDTEFEYTAWLSERYEYEKKYSKRMEESDLLAHKHIGMLQAMLSKASYYLSDVEKEEIKKDLAEMEKERLEFSQNTKF